MEPLGRDEEVIVASVYGPAEGSLISDEVLDIRCSRQKEVKSDNALWRPVNRKAYKKKHTQRGKIKNIVLQ